MNLGTLEPWNSGTLEQPANTFLLFLFCVSFLQLFFLHGFKFSSFSGFLVVENDLIVGINGCVNGTAAEEVLK